MPISVAHTNILEASTVSLVGVTAASGYPLYRVYDRVLGRMLRTSGTGTQKILVDQGASPAVIDSLIIPAGHNLTGCALSLEWSTVGDDVDGHWTAPDLNGSFTNPWTQADANLIFRQMTTAPEAKRYWRLKIAGASVAPELGEVFLASLVTFQAFPDYSGAALGGKWNRSRLESVSGLVSFFARGVARRTVAYEFPFIYDSELPAFQAWMDAWGGCRPFFFVDNAGNMFFAEVNEETYQFRPKPVGVNGLTVNITEVL